ncbi:MAG: hypothetical protein AAGG56_18495 [Pseudomonadota bacterium]
MDGQRAPASRFEPLAAEGFGQADHPKAGSKALLGVATFAHDDLDKGFCLRANSRGLPPDALRR